MKLDFNDGSYIDFTKDDSGKYLITISAKDFLNHKKMIVNSIQLSKEQYQQLIESIK